MKKQETYHTYVWENVLYDWSGGIVVVRARNIEEARMIIKREVDYSDSSDVDFVKDPTILGEGECVYVWGGS